MPDLLERVEGLGSRLENHSVAIRELLAMNHDMLARILRQEGHMEQRWQELLRQAERDRQRSDERFTAMRQEIKEDFAAMKKESDERFAAMQREAEQDRRRLAHQLAEITDSQGLMVENMVAPNLSRIAAQVFGSPDGINAFIRARRVHPSRKGENIEVDFAAWNDALVIIGEAKSKVNADKERAHCEKLTTIPEFFPEFTGKKLLPVVASVWFEDSMLRFMNSMGVLALGMGDETMELLNPELIQKFIR